MQRYWHPKLFIFAESNPNKSRLSPKNKHELFNINKPSSKYLPHLTLNHTILVQFDNKSLINTILTKAKL